MKPKKGKRPPFNKARDRRQGPLTRQLVLLDQGPLRRKAASECSREMARLEKAKAEWRRFEAEDKTGFERWMSANFGALVSRLRELEGLLQEKEAVIREVDFEMLSGGARSERAAYAKVRSRHENPRPDSAPPPPKDADSTGNPDFEEVPEFDQELIFQDFLRVALGMNPDRMSDRQYEKMFAEFKAKAFGRSGPECPPPPPSTPPKPTPGRIKEIYRQLVRRLHPDTRAESDTETSVLWHEVQEAYSAGNVERLEMLLALTDLQADASGDHTSLSQLRSVLKELRRSYNAIQRSLKAAKDDLAWNFSRLPDRTLLEKRVRRDLQTRLRNHEQRLHQLEALIASWSPRGKDRTKRASQLQADFLF